ncbi:hypothetical protein ScPMuIL_013591 [Solemya velum]
MASSNVDYYQRQKELQDILHTNEEKRDQLNQQLRTYWKSDERLAKIRAAKLQSYWKKICEDEKRSKERNEQILRHFDRIEAHLSKVSTRTEKLRVLKQQYAEYIEQTYPQWMEQVLQWRQQKHAQLSSQAPLHHTTPPPHRTASPVRPAAPPEQIYQNLEVRLDPRTQDHSRTMPLHSMDQPTDLRTQTTPPGSQTYSAKDKGSPQKFMEDDITDLRSIPQYQHEVYEDDGTYLEPHPYHEIQSRTEMMVDRDDGHDISEQVSSINLSAPIELAGQPVQSVTVERIGQTGSRAQEQAQPSHMMMSSPENESDSEFGDIDLPSISGRQAPTPTHQEERDAAMLNKAESVSDSPMPEMVSPEPVHQHLPMQRSLRSTSPVRPELTAEGLGILLKYVENDIPEALALERYYRSPHPTPAKRMDIIDKANNGQPLGVIDAELVSMVILEQVTLVVRSLRTGCLLPDTIWTRDTTKMGTVQFRSLLTSDAQPLWDVLFDHFTVLVRHKVMEANEVAAVFIPCLVEEDTEHQGKAFILLVRLLDAVVNEEEMGMSPRDTLDSQMNTARSSQTGGIPPLKFGSLLDKPFSDDESTFFDQSVPSRPKVPLNETAAYQKLLSGTMSRQPAYQPQEEDTDDEMEKQFASVLSPRDSDRSAPTAFASGSGTNIPSKQAELPPSETSPVASPVYVPTAIETRSNTSAAATNKPAVKMPVAAYKHFHDSDSDYDIELPGQRVENDQEDDYLEFYS